MINIDAAKRDPSQEFRMPHDVVICQDLSEAQKLDMLQRWAYDILSEQVATDECMDQFDNRGDITLDMLINAYRELGKCLILAEKIPTKHGA